MRTSADEPAREQPGREQAGLDLLTKVGTVLDVLIAGGEVSATDIAASTGQPVSSTYRLLTNLQGIGLVEPASQRGLFRLGLDCLRIGAAVESHLDVRAAALPELRWLCDTTGATAFLCLRRAEQAVCIERIEGPDVRWLAMRLGDSLPLYLGGAPLALLAHMPTAERDVLVTRFAEQDPQITVGRLRARISETRRRGYAVSDQDVTVGVAALGAPIFNHRGEIEAAVSISGLREVLLADDQPREALLHAAHRISTALGWYGGRQGSQDA
ncbi:IclR family transcriptional regulator [Kineococcus sp. SYSU DK003]|uniref:IclR family transcriptional regulator n=1 Tax=Kineococcus sp. SYSU DK003 TaxID=3383124 RepID=UPI003D7C3B59